MQVQVLDFVRERINRAGFSPTYQEIADTFCTTKSAAHRIVGQLIGQGKLRHPENKRRGIEIADRTIDLRTIDTDQLQAELARRGVVPGAFDRPARRPHLTGTTPCAAVGCDTPVRRGHAFCYRHWTKISPGTQQLLLRTHRLACELGDQPSAQAYQDAFGLAKDEAEARL
jgi:hypothetical protein